MSPLSRYEAQALASAASAAGKNVTLVPCPMSGPYASPWHNGSRVCQPPTTGTCNATFQLLRRTSGHGKCFPDGDPLVSGQIMWGGYGCYPGQERVWVVNRCAGRFVCESGRMVTCGKSANNGWTECQCPA